MITQDILKELTIYNPSTGIFTRRKKIWTFEEGSIMGTKRKDNYISIGINKKLYLAHRLAWLYMTGKWPKSCIDHINGIKDDNRWCNLREADYTENLYNSKKRKGKNTSKYKGVYYYKPTNKWSSRLQYKGKVYFLGYHNTEKEAYEAYCLKAKEIQGEFFKD